MTENTEFTPEDYKEASKKLQAVREETGKVIFGQDEVINNVLTTMVAGGHVMLLGVPGLAKTLLVNTLSTTMGLESKRIQFTPDKLPADITGREKPKGGVIGGEMYFDEGPIFAQMVLADEINRANPKTQAALLQAMQEYEVSENKKTYPLPNPSFIMATRNPLEQDGTYPLPEAQLDRFLMELELDYPDRDTELKIATTTKAYKRKSPESTKPDFDKVSDGPRAVMTPEDLIKMQKMVDAMPLDKEVAAYIVDLVRNGRPSEPGKEDGGINQYVSWPPGPRAVQALVVAAKGRALLEGRLSPSKHDVDAVTVPVLAHRMKLSHMAKADRKKMADILDMMRPK